MTLTPTTTTILRLKPAKWDKFKERGASRISSMRKGGGPATNQQTAALSHSATSPRQSFQDVIPICYLCERLAQAQCSDGARAQSPLARGKPVGEREMSVPMCSLSRRTTFPKVSS
jgi:hypothetical protein